MATIIERDVHSADSSSSAMTWVVALFAIVVLAVLALYVAGAYPFAPAPASTGSATNPVHVDVNTPAPTNPVTNNTK